MDHLPWWVRRHAVLYVVLGNCVILRNVLPGRHCPSWASTGQELCHTGRGLFLWLPYQRLQISSHRYCGYHPPPFTAVHSPLCCKLLQITAPGPPELPHSRIHCWCPFIPPGDDFFPSRSLGFPSLSRHAEHIEVNLVESSEGRSWVCTAVLQKHSQVLVWLFSSWIYLSRWTTRFFSHVILILARGRIKPLCMWIGK